jgi:WD40 repeat protein
MADRGAKFEGGGLAMAAACSNDATTLVTVHEDRAVKVWNSAGGKPVKVLWGHHETPVGVALSPDGNTIATAAVDGTLKLWKVPGR